MGARVDQVGWHGDAALASEASGGGRQAMAQFDISLVSMFVDGLDHPEGLAFAADGYLWAGGELGQVYRISPDGKQVDLVAECGGFSLGMAFDREGNLFVCNHGLP